MILGLLLAGGDSIRMGRQKSRLLVQGQEAWLHLARNMLAAGCDRIVMAIPSSLRDELRAVLPYDLAISFSVVPEAERARGPIGSLSHLILEHGESLDVCLVAPVDHPWVKVDTMRQLLDAKAALRIPTQAGRRGHPIVMDREVALRVPALTSTLRTLTRDPDIDRIEVAVTDECIHWNMDRPEDYQRYQQLDGH